MYFSLIIHDFGELGGQARYPRPVQDESVSILAVNSYKKYQKFFDMYHLNQKFFSGRWFRYMLQRASELENG